MSCRWGKHTNFQTTDPYFHRMRPLGQASKATFLHLETLATFTEGHFTSLRTQLFGEFVSAARYAQHPKIRDSRASDMHYLQNRARIDGQVELI